MTNDRAAGHRDFAERYTAAWCGQDPARVAEFFAPDRLTMVALGGR